MAINCKKYGFYIFLYLFFLIHSTRSQGRKELCAFNVQARYVNNQDIRITWSRFNNRCGNRFHIRANNFSRGIIRLRRNRQLVNEELVTSRSGKHVLRGVKNAGFVYFICSPTCDLLFQFRSQVQVVQLFTTRRPTTKATTTVNTTLQTTATTTRRTTLPYIPPYPSLPAPEVPRNEISTIIASTQLPSTEVVSTEQQTEQQGAIGANISSLEMPNTGIIIGALIGVSGLIVGAILAFIFYRRNKQDHSKKNNFNDSQLEISVHVYEQSEMPYSTKNFPYQNERFTNTAEKNRTLPYQNEKLVKSSSEVGKLPYQNERFGSSTTATLEYEFAHSGRHADKNDDTEDYLYPVVQRPESESYDDVELSGNRSSYEKLQTNANSTISYDKLFASKR